MHKNFYVFQSDSYYDLGLQMGMRFLQEAQNAAQKLKRMNWERKRKIAETTLNLSIKYFPQYVDELKGYANGAKIDFLDLWIINLESDIEANCTSLITNNGMMIGHNEDASLYGKHDNDICIVKKILKDKTSLEIFYYNRLSGNAAGINSYGYAITTNTMLFDKTRIGLPRNVTANCLFDSDDPIKTAKRILKLSRSSGYNYNIVHKSGEVFNFELLSDKGKIIEPKLPFVHTNHCLSIRKENTEKFGTIARYNRARELIKENMKNEEIIDLLNDKSKGKYNSIFNKATIGKMIVNFEEKVAKIWLAREKEIGWVDYPLDFIG